MDRLVDSGSRVTRGECTVAGERAIDDRSEREHVGARTDLAEVGVDLFGVSNWVRTLESIPAWWEAQRAALYAEIGDLQKDAQMLRDVSPVFHADRIRKPLIVLQGANDPRVIKPESDDIVAAVKKNGVPVEYVVFPDEGHGFTKKKNQIEGYSAVLKFLDRYLKGTTGPPSAGR